VLYMKGTETMKPIWAVGLMTGTVLDGNIDVALIRTDGVHVQEFGAYELLPYPDSINVMLERALKEAQGWGFEGVEPAIFAKAEHALTEAQSQAVLQVVEGAGLSMHHVGVVGFHGQTVLHRAPAGGRLGATRQLGNGEQMARIVGADVVCDMRSADMATGGHGAPLSPVYHAALLSGIDADEGTAILNLGGVGNVTWRGNDGSIAGFDTGPANAPINDFVRSRGMGDMDRDGTLARSGKVSEALLNKQLTHPYFDLSYPKSLDRFDFGHDWVNELSTEDGAATLTAFSAAAVAKALDILPTRPAKLMVCGGGRRNPALMGELNLRAFVQAVPVEEVGWRGDAIEAECFAFLAVRSLRGLPLSFSSTTGVPVPTCGGRIAQYEPVE
jgi:anhydro-N-acetylmuramic acid kinase